MPEAHVPPAQSTGKGEGGEHVNYLFNLCIKALVLVTCLPIHEYAHAYVAYRLGDPTAKNQGRLTLNPLAHLDPLGAIAMLFAGFGWAKPVPINPYYFKNPKAGMAISSLAGPISNILVAFVLMVAYKLMLYSPLFSLGIGPVSTLAVVLVYMIQINLSLAVFNLLPIPPLDGSRLATYFLPQHIYFKVMQYERYIFFALMLVLVLGFLDTPISWLSGRLLQVLDSLTYFVDVLAGMLFRR